MLNKKQLNYIVDNFNLIALSFDGLPDVQDKNRVTANSKGTFLFVGETLQFFKERDVPIILRTTIWPEDYNRLNEMVEYVCKHYPNVSAWAVEPVNPRGRANDKNKETIEESFLYHFIQAKELMQSRNYPDILICGKFKENIIDFVCGTPYGINPWLLPNGNVVTCLDAKEHASIVAKISENQMNMMTFKDTLIESYLKNREVCKECYAFYFCGGGCPLRYINQKEKEFSSRECNMIKQYWYYIFNKLINDESVFGWISINHQLPSFPGLKIRQIWRPEWKLL